MLEFVSFLLSSVWNFIGGVIILVIFGSILVNVIGAIGGLLKR